MIKDKERHFIVVEKLRFNSNCNEAYGTMTNLINAITPKKLNSRKIYSFTLAIHYTFCFNTIEIKHAHLEHYLRIHLKIYKRTHISHKQTLA